MCEREGAVEKRGGLKGPVSWPREKEGAARKKWRKLKEEDLDFIELYLKMVK